MTWIDEAYLRQRLLRRPEESHKGDYGHLLIVAGCQSMPGAAVLATEAALRSGCGLVTLHSTPRALQAAVVRCPSAMLSEDPGEGLSRLPVSMDKYSAIAVGPGLGRLPETKEALLALLAEAKERRLPVVVDADALNILSEVPNWQELVPEGSVLTPHLGELRRLFHWDSVDERDRLAQAFCADAGCALVMKGFHSRIFTPAGACLVNTTGNPGLAKGGSGDVLTGLLGGLLARGYAAADAAALAVWLHGRAGDRLTAERTAEAWSSLDLAGSLYKGFIELYDEEDRR
jgi:NAD(P)H-hydrate epimerase